MRIAGLIVLVASCAACGLVSGLDGLQVGDASGEAATTDARPDAADAGSDVDAGATPPCLYVATPNDCVSGSSGCAIQGTDAGCCVTPDAGTSCQTTCAWPSFFLWCSTSKQCSTSAPTCCLSGVTSSASTLLTCPITLQTSAIVVSSQCGTDLQCGGQPRLCTSTADCPTGKTCEEAVVDVSPVVFGACMPIQ